MAIRQTYAQRIVYDVDRALEAVAEIGYTREDPRIDLPWIATLVLAMQIRRLVDVIADAAAELRPVPEERRDP